jgi:HlyD family secretion protein
MKNLLYLLLIAMGLLACQSDTLTYDASGTFEAEELIISSEANGKILALEVEEGQEIEAGAVIGYLDSSQLVLRKKQLEASIRAILSRQPNAEVQLAAIESQIETAESEKKRVESLLAAEAATPKQLDDLEAQIRTLEKQLAAQRSVLSTTTRSIRSETQPLYTQIEQVEDQLRRCQVVNPVKGTVLNQYAKAYEMTGAGKPLYKLADLSALELRAYLSGTQLPKIQLGQEAEVLVDDGEGGYKSYQGTVSWISDRAEFTPKTIQTQDERANLVYAIKVKVPNDGYIKIGMYGEVKL